MFLVGELSAQFRLPVLLGPVIGRALGICGLFYLRGLPGVGSLLGFGGLLRLRRAAGIEGGSVRARRRDGLIGLGAALGLRGFRLLRGLGTSRAIGRFLGTFRGLRRLLIGRLRLGFRRRSGIRFGLFRCRLRLGSGA